MSSPIQLLKKQLRESHIQAESKKALLEELSQHGLTEDFVELVRQVFALEAQLVGLQARHANQMRQIYEEVLDKMQKEGQAAFNELNGGFNRVVSQLEEVEAQAHELLEKLNQERAKRISLEV